MLKKLILVYCQLMLVWGCSCGQQIFQKRYEYPGLSQNAFRDVIKTSDSTFIVVGNAYNNSGSIQSYIAGIDTSGNIHFQKNYDFLVTNIFKGNINNHYLTGLIAATPSNIIVQKNDQYGNPLNKIEIGGAYRKYLTQCIATQDSGIMLVGYFKNLPQPNPYGPYYGFVLKLDKNETIQWCKKFGGNAATSINDVWENNNNSYSLLCTTTQFNNDTVDYLFKDLVLINLDSNGVILNAFSILSSGEENGYDLNKIPNGDWIFTFTSDMLNPGLGEKKIILRTDSLLNQIWANRYIVSLTLGVSSFVDFGIIDDTLIYYLDGGSSIKLLDMNGNSYLTHNNYGVLGNNFTRFLNSNAGFYCIGSTSVGAQSYASFIKMNSQLQTGCYENNGSQLQIDSVLFTFHNVNLPTDTISFQISTIASLIGNSPLIEHIDCSGFVNIKDEEIRQLVVYPTFIGNENEIKIELAEPLQEMKITVINSLGQVVLSVFSKSNKEVGFKLPANLSSGIYYLLVSDENRKIKSVKIFKYE